jgi:hypothetical protein
VFEGSAWITKAFVDFRDLVEFGIDPDFDGWQIS